MRLLIIVLLFLLSKHLYGLTVTCFSGKELSFQNGIFECRLNNYILFSYTEDDGEYPLYKLYSININTNEQELIDSLLTQNCRVKTSDSTFVYSINGTLYKWNSETKTKETLFLPDSIKDIIGIGFNEYTNKFLIFDYDNDNSIVKLNICDNSLNCMFRQRIEFNEAEMEGIFPIVYSTLRYTIFSIQDKLYILDCLRDVPKAELISDKCSDFAANEDKEVLFDNYDYKGIYTFNIESMNIKSIELPGELKNLISSCPGSDMSTAYIGNKNVPMYIICSTSYFYSDYKWDIAPEAIIYKDDKIIVKLPDNNKKPIYECFEWKLLSK